MKLLGSFERLARWWRQRNCPHLILEKIGKGLRTDWATPFIWHFDLHRCALCGEEFEIDTKVTGSPVWGEP